MKFLIRESILAAAFYSMATLCGEAPKLPPPAARAVDFVKDIQPIFRANCYACHGPEKQKGHFRLDVKASALAGGDETDILPGKSAQSPLIINVAYLDENLQMPPPDKGKKLSDEQIGLLRAWIDQGAVWPDGVDDGKIKNPRDHWAFKKPIRPALPTVQKKDWPRNEIDAFVLARLEKEGLAPSREADKAVLLRRVSLDLVGLPPSVEEVLAFEADANPDAYEKAVDRLLASPHYGERWARPWLDAARYGDTHGYEKDPPRTMWPWRDWVINALNKNMPFDEFTIDQLAGDLLPNATLEQKVATGFHRNSLLNDEGGTDPEEFRMAALNDRVETTSTVWLGLTMNCAQCHSHKFDPIAQKEYYQFLAFFNNTEDGGRAADPVLPVPQAGQDAAKAPKTMIMQERKQPRDTFVAIRGSFRSPGEKVTPGVPAFLNPLKAGETPNRLALAKWLVDENNPLTARVIMNRYWGQFFSTPLVETVEDFGTRGEAPSHPELLEWLATEFVAKKWDVKAMHKLIVMSATYRQASNAMPSLIERDPYNRLLARGPRFRVEAEMVRDIALAASGRLSKKIGGPSVFPPQPPGIWENSFGFQSFAGNQSNWKTDESEDRYRRGLYIYWRRTAPYPSLQTFDLVSRDVCKVKRSRTNTPLQALTILNDPVYVECAGGLAERMEQVPANNDAVKIEYGFRCCVSRKPTAVEIQKLQALLGKALGEYRDRKSAETLLSQARIKTEPGGARAMAAWVVVANVLLNLDETISKN